MVGVEVDLRKESTVKVITKYSIEVEKKTSTLIFYILAVILAAWEFMLRCNELDIDFIRVPCYYL